MNQQMVQSSRSEKNTYFFHKTQFFNTNPLQMLKIIISFIMCIVVSTLYASTINVKDFGAKGNGINDDAPAIKKAIEVAIKQKAEKLLFPKGTYAVKKFFSVHHIFAFENVENLTIEGEDGALILVKNPKIGCMSFFQECRIALIETYF